MKARSVAAAAVAASAPVVSAVIARARWGRHAMRPATLPAEDVHWEVLPRGPAEVRCCLAWGDMEHGPYGAFFKFPPGFCAPLHTHGAATRIIVISGAYVYGLEGQPKRRFGAGSYLVVPGDAAHTADADPDDGCVFFIEQERGFRLDLEDEATKH